MRIGGRQFRSVDDRVAKARMLVAYAKAADLAHIAGGEAEMTGARGEPGAEQAAHAKPAARPVRSTRSVPLAACALEEAHRAGLLDGDTTQPVRFPGPPARVEAARHEAGVSATSELGVVALAMLARPDPVAAFFRRTEGRLGPDHDLQH